MSEITVLSRYQAMVKTFNMSIGAKPDKDLRIKLIQEEAEELMDAVKVQNVVQVIDAICDLLYVTYGAADVFRTAALTDERYENWPVTRRTPDWVRLNDELEGFNESVSWSVQAIRNFKDFEPKGKLFNELQDLAEGLWQCAAEGVGVNLKPFFEEVHRTNMHKLQGPQREDGKQLKPEGWKPPRIEAMYLRWRNGQQPHCDVLAPIHQKDHSYDIAFRIEHPEGGYHCQQCGGLFVSWELSYSEDIKRGKAKNPYADQANP